MPTKSTEKWTRYQYGMVIVLLLVMTIAYMDRINISVVLPVWIKEYHLSPTVAGFLASVFNWTYCLSLLFIGPLIDKFHPKRVFPIGVGMWSFATLLSGFTILLPVLTVARGLLGLGESTMMPSTVRMISEIWKKKDWGKVTGVSYSGTRIGLTIGAPLAATILAVWGWQMVFYVTGIISAVWLILFYAVYRQKNNLPTEETTLAPTQASMSWGKLLTYRSTWALMFGQAGYLYIFYVFITWLPSYFVIERHMTALKSGFTSMLPFLVATFTIVLGGWIADKWLSRGGKITVVRKTLICSGLSMATVFVIIAAYASSTVVALVSLILSMGFLGLATANLNILAADIAPKNSVASLNSLQNFGGNLGGALAPVVTGFLLSLTHNFQVALLTAGAVSLIFGVGSYGFLLGKVETLVDKDAPSTSGSNHVTEQPIQAK